MMAVPGVIVMVIDKHMTTGGHQRCDRSEATMWIIEMLARRHHECRVEAFSRRRQIPNVTVGHRQGMKGIYEISEGYRGFCRAVGSGYLSMAAVEFQIGTVVRDTTDLQKERCIPTVMRPDFE